MKYKELKDSCGFSISVPFFTQSLEYAFSSENVIYSIYICKLQIIYFNISTGFTCKVLGIQKAVAFRDLKEIIINWDQCCQGK